MDKTDTDEPDLFSIGEHCQESSCRQKDFLPFKCDCCQKVYCLEHRAYSAHSCAKANGKQETTIICPLCARLVRIAAGSDPNAIFEEHTRQDCEPSNYARVNRKPRCPVPGCKEKLSVVNTHVCKHCNVSVCLKHRFAADHSCRQGSTYKGSTRPLLSNLLGFGSSQSGSSATHSQAGQSSSLAKVAATSRQPPKADPGPSSGQSRPRSGQSVVRGQGRDAASVKGNSRSVSQGQFGREICPVCQKGFRDVTQLIAHSREHELDTESQEVCPHCHAIFPNAILLVDHVERQHTDNKGCVVC